MSRFEESVFERIQRECPVDEDEFMLYMLDSEEYRMQQIIPNLWLGNQVAAGGLPPFECTAEYLSACLSNLKEKGITHIICLAEGLCKFSEHFQYLQLRVADISQDRELAIMSDFFPVAFDFIESAISVGGAVLVHCNAGMSRSPTVVVSYLMRKLNYSYREAVIHCRSIRKCITTHCFERALLSFESKHKLEISTASSSSSTTNTTTTATTTSSTTSTSRRFSELPDHSDRRTTAKLAQLDDQYPWEHEILPGLFLGTQGSAGIGLPGVSQHSKLSHLRSLRSQSGSGSGCSAGSGLELESEGNRGITHIVNCTGNQKAFASDESDGITYFCINLPHSVEKSGREDWADLSVSVPAAVQFISEALQQGGRVLVHCNNGENRSAAVVVAYVMGSQHWGLDKAYMHVRGIRAVVECKLEEYLRSYEQDLLRKGLRLEFY